MLNNVMLLQQIQAKTGLNLELPGNAQKTDDDDCNDGIHCKKKRLFLFDVVDKDDGEVLVTVVFPKSWLGKLGGGGATIIAALYFLTNSGLIP